MYVDIYVYIFIYIYREQTSLKIGPWRLIHETLCIRKFICFFWLNNKLYIDIQGESKKSVIFGAWCKTVPFLCNYPEWCFFYVYFLKICNLFWYSIWSKKNPRTFYIIKSGLLYCKSRNKALILLFVDQRINLIHFRHPMDDGDRTLQG